ncbi:MAG TPA: hypothetical protein VLR71_19865 [Casimicrobiaceae bacterium]|nr:hypothetical protein [Casimicrobiaceae bacterium]
MATRKTTSRAPTWAQKKKQIDGARGRVQAAIKALQQAEKALSDAASRPPGGGQDITTNTNK